MIGPAPEVRPITAADRDDVAGALARAFHDDPVMTWFFPDDDRRLALNRRFFSMRIRQLLPHGATYTVPDRSAAALWAEPGRWKLGRIETIRMTLALLPALASRGRMIARGVEAIDRSHPRAPHYYLAVLGTEPEAQGRGYGSALMQPVLEACDRDEIPAFLESSKERNIDFYARHGFRVVEEIRLPDGPPVWPMWRDPRP